jgi:hypothetical protein
MDSDGEEDVSESEILEWYKSEVQDLWDTATASAFEDFSSNITEMFQQVMNDVRQRNETTLGNGSSTQQASIESHTNGHLSSIPNGLHSSNSSDTNPSPNASHPLNTVSISSGQLMSMLQDDENWLEEDATKPTQEEERMVLSVQLTDSNNYSLEDKKNGTEKR